MIALALSVLSSTIIMVVFKLFDRYKIQTFQAIVVNYGVCVLCGVVLAKQSPSLELLNYPWYPFTFVLGMFFITGFFAAGKTIEYFGVSVGAVVSKMSIAISVSAAFFLFKEEVNALKLIGILLSVAAIFLVCKKDVVVKFNKRYLIFPIAIFIIGGINEVVLNYVSITNLDKQDLNIFNISLFGNAFFFGLIILTVLYILKKITFSFKDVLAGVLLGIPNYFSIYFLLKALQIDWLGSAAIYPITNVSVISLSALIAWLFLNERISILNFIGICLAIFAIVLITFGSL